MLADIVPTSYEVGVLNGNVRPGDTVVVIGAGPIGLAAVTCAQLFSPGHIVVADLLDQRLQAAKSFGADVIVNTGREDLRAAVDSLTDGLGADVAIEAVGIPATFELVHPRDPSGRSGRQRRRATASPPRCTSRTCGSPTSPSRPGSSTRLHSDAAPADRRAPHRHRPVRHPSLPLRRVPRGVRRVQRAPGTPALLDELHRSEKELWCIGSHARGALWEMLLHSLSEGLVRTSHVPVVLVGPMPRQHRSGA